MKLELDDNSFWSIALSMLTTALAVIACFALLMNYKTKVSAFTNGYSEVQQGGSDYTMWQKKP